MTSLIVNGSGECEQLGLGDDAKFIYKKSQLIKFFEQPSLGPLHFKIYKVVCGGMHSVALSTHGQVFTWGCNDENALGRPGAENEPLLVDGLKTPMTDVTAGDSHTLAYNTHLNVIYMWG